MIRVLAIALLGVSGCATTTALMDVTGQDDLLWFDSGQVESPESPLVQKVNVSVLYEPPPPKPAAALPVATAAIPQPPPPVQPWWSPPPGPPPPPGSWAPMPPAPAPTVVVAAPPAPAGLARLSCTVAGRYPKVYIHESQHKFGTGWKIVAGFVALSEAAFGTAMIDVSQTQSSGGHGFLLGSGIFLAADALGQIFWIAQPTQYRTRNYEGIGNWNLTGGCPPGMSVTIAGRRYSVSPGGELSGDGGAQLFSQMLAQDGGFVIAVAGREQGLSPSPSQRCAWLWSAGIVPSCPMPEGPTDFGAMFPLGAPAPAQQASRQFN